MKEKVPTWLKLDNAATIYPSTLSRNYAAMFRVSMTLKNMLEKLANYFMKNLPTIITEPLLIVMI